MSDIKMSDVFGDELETMLQAIEHAEDCCTLKELNAIRTSIIAYDANQDRIAELESWREKAFECYPNIDMDIERLAK